MDVRIGAIQTPREIEVELPSDSDPQAVRESVESALRDGRMVWLVDRKGRQIGVPADKVAYVEIGAADGDRRIGFGS